MDERHWLITSYYNTGIENLEKGCLADLTRHSQMFFFSIILFGVTLFPLTSPSGIYLRSRIIAQRQPLLSPSFFM